MLYKLIGNSNTYQKVKRVNLASINWKEKNLQNLISNNIQDFISSNDLMVIFNERDRQEEPDILALDSNGDLYIFELKRWEGKQENLLQVLRYGQLFGKSNYEDLNGLYQKFLKSKDAQLETDFKYHFGKEIGKDKFNAHQHFLVVTNGLDQQTVESVIYWKSCGLNIGAIVYWVFEIENNYYIEFNTFSCKENYLEYENNSYLLNTNISNNSFLHESMLKDGKAAAFYPGRRELIQKLQKDDLVFLYQSGAGIVAYGRASGTLNKAMCDGYEDYEYNMKLNPFYLLEEPIPASRLREITNCGFNFRATMNALSDESSTKMLEYINKNCHVNRIR